MRRSTLHRTLAAAALAAMLAACGNATSDAGASGQGDETPVATETDGTAPADDGSDAGDEPSETDDGARDDGTPAEDEDAAAPAEDDGFRVDGRELIRVLDGEATVLHTLPAEGESTFEAVAVRPGDHAQLTVVVLTSAEGMYDLRWLDVEGTSASELQVFDAPYRPLQDLTAAADVAPLPLWAPDGSALAWLEWNADGDVQLRTVGWDGGPGTGETETDNAAFGLDLPAGVQLRSWTAQSDTHSVLRIESQAGDAWDLTIERQADGAFALAPQGALQPAG
jgi:hypothetical protein